MVYTITTDDDGELTAFGHKMSELPLEPQLAAMLLNSPDYNCSNEVGTYIVFHLIRFNIIAYMHA